MLLARARRIHRARIAAEQIAEFVFACLVEHRTRRKITPVSVLPPYAGSRGNSEREGKKIVKKGNNNSRIEHRISRRQSNTRSRVVERE